MAILIEEAVVSTTSLRVKFLKSVRVSSISNDRFKLYKANVLVTDPFKDINLSVDYNSISRTITLYYEGNLVPLSHYKLTISGLQDPSGGTFADESFEFDTKASTTPLPTDPQQTTVTVPDVIDFSITSDTFDPDTVYVPAETDRFWITGSDPTKAEPIVTTGYADGRVTLKFNKMPGASYINSTNFKAQRKPMQREFARWETVPVQYAVDTVKPWVYLDFPSTDTTPVYHTAGKEYFPLDYKFRVRVSKEIEPAVVGTGTSTGVLNLTIEKGATFSRTLTYLQASGAPRDLTGYSARMQIKDVYGGALLYELTTGNGRIVIDGPNGKTTLTLSAVQTAGLTFASGVYDLELVSPAATPVVTRLVEGTVTVTPEVTT